MTVVAVFRAHECFRIFPQFFTDRGVLLLAGLQCRVVLQKLLVVDERWVLTKLLSDLAVAVEKLVEALARMGIFCRAALTFALRSKVPGRLCKFVRKPL